MLMLALGIQLNIGLAIFNMLPIPPLDGSRILTGLLPRNWAYRYARLEPYGFLVLLVLIFTGVVQKIILPAILYLSYFLRGGVL
jgi:Zn-dependent protease